MGRLELLQERVHLGRAPLAAAGHAVAALALPGIVVIVCGVPVEALATLLLRKVGVDPAHLPLTRLYNIRFFNPINSVHNLNGIL